MWNCIAAFIWAAAYAGFGYLFGDVIGHMHRKEQVVDYSVREVTLSVLALFALVP